MIRKLTLTLLALAFCLSGCGSQVCETTLPPETAPSVTEPSETVPPTTLPPTEKEVCSAESQHMHFVCAY